MMCVDGNALNSLPLRSTCERACTNTAAALIWPRTTGAFFVNFADQNIYRVALTGGVPIAVTHTDIETRYADFVFDEPRARLIAVGERPGEKERENCLLAIDVRTGTATDLHRGHDFYRRRGSRRTNAGSAS